MVQRNSEGAAICVQGSFGGTGRSWKNTVAREQLEAMVRDVAGLLEAKGACKLWKIPNDLRITGSGAMAFCEQTPCDFFGHTSEGKVILIECKDVKGARLPFSAAGFKPHQRTALEECAKTSGIAILLWKHQDQVVALTPWEVAKLSEGRRSLAWSAVEDMARPFSRKDLSDVIAEALR